MTDYPADGPIPVDALPEDLAAAPGLTVLDVRDPGEWDLGHAPGAVHLPLPDLPVRFEEIDLDAQVYVICRGGGRSEQADPLVVAHRFQVHPGALCEAPDRQTSCGHGS